MFDQGLAARRIWENWFNALNGDARDGASFWAAERSKLNPGSCTDGQGQIAGAFGKGAFTPNSSHPDRPAAQNGARIQARLEQLLTRGRRFRIVLSFQTILFEFLDLFQLLRPFRPPHAHAPPGPAPALLARLPDFRSGADG